MTLSAIFVNASALAASETSLVGAHTGCTPRMESGIEFAPSRNATAMPMARLSSRPKATFCLSAIRVRRRSADAMASALVGLSNVMPR